MADSESAPVGERFRATLRMLAKLTRDGHLSAEDVRAVPYTPRYFARDTQRLPARSSAAPVAAVPTTRMPPDQ
jgi:hypothetical protein